MTRKDGDRRHARGSEARARRRQSQRRARCPRIPLEQDQQCEEGDPDGGKHQAHFYRLRPQRRDVRPDTSALRDGDNLDLMVAHQDDIAGDSADWSPRPPAGAPESARNGRRLNFSKPVSGFNVQPTPAPANFRSNCRTRACSNFNCLVVRLGHSGGL
jgi:hypothetical protein